MRILFATTAGAGHVGPIVPFARACERAGHDVIVAGRRSTICAPKRDLAPDPAAELIGRALVFTCAPRALEDPSAPASLRVRRFRDTGAAPSGSSPRPLDPAELPLVYVSFGSEAPRSHLFPDLYRAAVDALGELPVRTPVTIGNRRDPAELGSYREAAGRVAGEIRALPPVDRAVEEIVATARRRDLAA